MKLKDPELVWVQVQDEVVVLDTRTSLYSSLNHSAAKLWVALSTGTTVTELETLLQEDYGVDIETAKRDVASFVEVLREQDMLDEELE
jgi:hypothetical protein